VKWTPINTSKEIEETRNIKTLVEGSGKPGNIMDIFGGNFLLYAYPVILLMDTPP
jgi:hypothetical protein